MHMIGYDRRWIGVRVQSSGVGVRRGWVSEESSHIVGERTCKTASPQRRPTSTTRSRLDPSSDFSSWNLGLNRGGRMRHSLRIGCRRIEGLNPQDARQCSSSSAATMSTSARKVLTRRHVAAGVLSFRPMLFNTSRSYPDSTRRSLISCFKAPQVNKHMTSSFSCRALPAGKAVTNCNSIAIVISAPDG